jgi:hypothetical protein
MILARINCRENPKVARPSPLVLNSPAKGYIVSVSNMDVEGAYISEKEPDAKYNPNER